jgi:hypothetical protein
VFTNQKYIKNGYEIFGAIKIGKEKFYLTLLKKNMFGTSQEQEFEQVKSSSSTRLCLFKTFFIIITKNELNYQNK